jgi:hypothetical protein
VPSNIFSSGVPGAMKACSETYIIAVTQFPS